MAGEGISIPFRGLRSLGTWKSQRQVQTRRRGFILLPWAVTSGRPSCKCAGRLSGTVSPFRAEQGTSLETPSRPERLRLFEQEIWNYMDCSPPGSSVHGTLQERVLEWGALSRVRLLATSWTAAHQAPLSMGFSRQEYWSPDTRLGEVS